MTFSEISHHPEHQQFSLEVDGKVAVIDYTEHNGKLYLQHSEVPYELRGKGVGKELVEKTFEYIEAQGLKAVAICAFIKSVAQRSNRWQAVIDC